MLLQLKTLRMKLQKYQKTRKEKKKKKKFDISFDTNISEDIQNTAGQFYPRETDRGEKL